MAEESPWRRWGLILLWVLVGALVIAGFFLVAYFRAYSPVEVGDPGAFILFVPLFTGFMLGLLLTDEEIVVAAGAGVLSAVLAIALIGGFLFAPVFAGVATPDRAFVGASAPQIMFSTILLFPLVVVGSAIGRGIGDLFLPSPRLKAQLDALREETRRWHEALERMENRTPEGGVEQKPPEPPPERKG